MNYGELRKTKRIGVASDYFFRWLLVLKNYNFDIDIQSTKYNQEILENKEVLD